MEIRFVRPEEVRQLQRNVVTGFPSKTPQELLENMAGELVSPQEGRYLGCFDEDNTLIGSLLMMDFQQNIRGKLMNMGGIAYVSTGFLRKKEHIARNMIRVAIGVFAGTGTYVGGLHPFNPAFYGKMGYGYCNESMMFSPKTSVYPFLRPQGTPFLCQGRGPGRNPQALPETGGEDPWSHHPPLYGLPSDL